jgi:hypothetical protein
MKAHPVTDHSYIDESSTIIIRLRVHRRLEDMQSEVVLRSGKAAMERSDAILVAQHIHRPAASETPTMQASCIKA